MECADVSVLVLLDARTSAKKRKKVQSYRISLLDIRDILDPINSDMVEVLCGSECVDQKRVLMHGK